MNTIFFGFSLEQWVWLLAYSLIIFLLLILLKKTLLKISSSKTRFSVPEFQDTTLILIKNTKSFALLLISVFIALLFLDFTIEQYPWLKKGLILLLLVQVGIWGGLLITKFLDRYAHKKMEEDASMATGLKFSSFLLRVFFYSLLVIIGLDNIGVDVTTMIAGLGVGGIAIALSAQNVLGDLFASLSIVLDKPFVLGDFIIVGDKLGTIEKIGLKTTRVRSLSGEQLIFPNSDLLQSRIHNYKRMNERRIVFQFGVIYQTTKEELEQIPKIIREIIGNVEQTRFDRAHFKTFGPSSYDFEVVYWLLTPDYNAYMNVQQEINLKIVERFAEESIHLAYPTRTIYMAK